MTDLLVGECDAYTTKECVVFDIRTTANRLEAALALLLDLTEAPAFTAEDVETERGVILEEMAEAADVPEDRLQDDLVRALWPRSSARRSSARRKPSPRSRAPSSPSASARSSCPRAWRSWLPALDPDKLLALMVKERARRGSSRARPARAQKAPRRTSPRATRCSVHLEAARPHAVAPPHRDARVRLRRRARAGRLRRDDRARGRRVLPSLAGGPREERARVPRGGGPHAPPGRRALPH